MTRIWTGCENLLQPISQTLSPSILKEDTTWTVNVTNSSTLLISEDLDRESLKIFVISTSNSFVEVWLRFGQNASVENAAFILPLRNLLMFSASELPQIRGNISAITNSGSASVRVCSA